MKKIYHFIMLWGQNSVCVCALKLSPVCSVQVLAYDMCIYVCMMHTYLCTHTYQREVCVHVCLLLILTFTLNMFPWGSRAASFWQKLHVEVSEISLTHCPVAPHTQVPRPLHAERMRLCEAREISGGVEREVRLTSHFGSWVMFITSAFASKVSRSPAVS